MNAYKANIQTGRVVREFLMMACTYDEAIVAFAEQARKIKGNLLWVVPTLEGSC